MSFISFSFLFRWFFIRGYSPPPPSVNAERIFALPQAIKFLTFFSWTFDRTGEHSANAERISTLSESHGNEIISDWVNAETIYLSLRKRRYDFIADWQRGNDFIADGVNGEIFQKNTLQNRLRALSASSQPILPRSKASMISILRPSNHS